MRYLGFPHMLSYFDLVHLDEQMGNVSIGLSDEAIFTHLRSQQYQPLSSEESNVAAESCCICLVRTTSIT